MSLCRLVQTIRSPPSWNVAVLVFKLGPRIPNGNNVSKRGPLLTEDQVVVLDAEGISELTYARTATLFARMGRIAHLGLSMLVEYSERMRRLMFEEMAASMRGFSDRRLGLGEVLWIGLCE